MVALAQGAAVSAAKPNPDGSKSDQSRDFLGQGIGNLVGCFFQSMTTGGSLSQTSVSVSAGANGRLGGIFAGLWMGLIVLLFGSYAEKVPLAVIGGMLIVNGVELLLARIPDARLVIRGGDKGGILGMALTFFAALFVPLQYTILLGAGLSLLLYIVASANKLELKEVVRLDDGDWEIQDAPQELKSNQVTALIIQGLDFYAEVPRLTEQIPPAKGVHNAVLILILRDLKHTSSTAVKWFEWYARELQANGSLLILADVNPMVVDILNKAGATEIIGAENIFPATTRILAAEIAAWQAAQAWLQTHQLVEKQP
jgi:SulP family sulfate permease